MQVMTVLGPVEARDLGTVLPHEHVLFDGTAQWAPPEDPGHLAEAIRELTPSMLGRVSVEPLFYRQALQLTDVAAAVEELTYFRDAGGQTVVDLTPPALGRDPVALAAIARLTGLHIVMGCGEYVERSHSAYVAGASVEQIADVLIRELNEGVGRTGIRAGTIGEIGSGNPVGDRERKVLRAVAIAQRATGVSVTIHRTVFPDLLAPLEALDVVLKEGVDPSRVAMAHCDERPEAEFALAVGERGAWIALDTWGFEKWAAAWVQDGIDYPRSTDRDRLDMLRRLLDAGYAGRVLVSHDTAFPPLLVRNGGWGYAHLLRDVRPRMQAIGMSDAEVDQLFRENPRDFLTGASGPA